MYVCKQTALIVILFLPAFAGAATVEFVAGTPAGWDFHGLATDIARNNTVDFDDLNIVAQRWLNSNCDDVNQLCGGADIDATGQVDFFDYAFLVRDWSKQAGENVLLQTIYGSAQDANGTITANSYHALSVGKECLMVFAVPQATLLDKGWFKLTGFKAGYTFRVRLFNVTGQGLLNTGHTITKASLDSGSPLVDVSISTGSSVPSHTEGAQAVTDLFVNFGPLSVTAGEYLIAFNNVSGGNTIGSIVRGAGTNDEPNKMGRYQDNIPLPKRATVTTTAGVGNTYFYYLSSSSSTSYQPVSNLLAFQILTGTGTVANTAPQANAGTNQTIINPIDSVNLDGTVADDGLPNPPGVVTTAWTKQSGPGTATFGDASVVDTTATFSAYGTYVLRLTASDGSLSSYDEVTITYLDSAPSNQAPSVNAGSDRQVVLPASTSLDGTVTDDGLPNPPGVVTTLWTKQSGPGTVTFGDSAAVDTTASFSATGTYVLRLTANDSALSSYDEVTVTVQPAGDRLIYHVTTLAASGTGSLDDCISKANSDGKPSRIVFDVSGTIKPGKGFSLTESDTQICGTEAPGSGVTIDFNGTTGGFGVPAAGGGCRFCNLLIQNTKTNTDGISLFGKNNTVERCSFDLCRDEGVGMSSSRGNIVAFSRFDNCGSQPGDGTSYANGRGILLTGSGSGSSSAIIVGNYIYHCNRGITANTGATFMDCRHNHVEHSLSSGSGAGITNAGVTSNTISNICSYNATSGFSYKLACTFYRSGNTGTGNTYYLESVESGTTEKNSIITVADTPFPSWLTSATTPASESDVGKGTGLCQCIIGQ